MHRGKLVNIIGIAALICLLFLVPLLWKSLYWIHILILTGLNVLLAVSLRALLRTGQISLGTAGFMLLGAYSSALLAIKLGLSFWITLPLGGLLAAIVALIVGYPFLRAKGIYFAILTVMLAEVSRLIAWYWPSLTGGSAGLQDIPPPDPISIPGIIILTFDTKIAYYYLMLVIVIVCLTILYRIERSWLGLMWSAINEADNLAQAVGINIMGHKMLIFCVSSFFMGVAGALYAHYMGTLSPYGTPGTPFGFTASIYVLIYVVVGGETRFAGPIIGAIVLTIVPELVRGLQEYVPLIFGGLFIIIVLLMPEGITSLSAPLSHWSGRAIRYITMKLRRV
jgi:branched-chain amino acid transport system permease protein